MKHNIEGILILHPFRSNSVFREIVQHNENNNQLGGESSDFYGNAMIKGTLDLRAGVLEFNKVYKNGVKMRYSMVQGRFSSPRGTFFGEVFTEGVEMPYGEVMCEIYSDGESKFNWEEKARTAEMSPEGMEKLTGITIDRMEKKGQVKKYKDKRGKEMVQLTKKGEKDLLEDTKNRL